VIACLGDKTDRLSLWCKSLVERRGFKRAIVALAANDDIRFRPFAGKPDNAAGTFDAF